MPITMKEAERTNHYEVNYDSEGRISRIMHFSKGLLNDGSYIGVAVVAMEYKDRYTWLPRQDQLQNMIEKFKQDKNIDLYWMMKVLHDFQVIHTAD